MYTFNKLHRWHILLFKLTNKYDKQHKNCRNPSFIMKQTPKRRTILGMQVKLSLTPN